VQLLQCMGLELMAAVSVERGMDAATSMLASVEAGAYTRPHFSSTSAVLVTTPHVPLCNTLGEIHAANISHKMCLR